ncbi:MAG: type II secretion system protein [Candidatus Gastranaerophilaceae bacterium]
MNKEIQPRYLAKSSKNNILNAFIFSLKNTNKFIAFTLAETLIVMGIIGVVAALTIPNLNASTNDAEKIAKFKKTYAELVQAHDRATAVYGPVETWFTGITDAEEEALSAKYFDRLTEFMKVTKTCGSNESAEVDCMTSIEKNELYGGSSDTTDYRSAILAGGSSVGVYIWSSTCTVSYYDKPSDRSIMCGFITLDIDGPRKGKNTLGIDLFPLTVTKEGIMPSGESSSYLATSMEDCTNNGYACAQWIMDHGNMDYLKASHTDDDTTGTCNNDSSKQLGYGPGKVQSCK